MCWIPFFRRHLLCNVMCIDERDDGDDEDERDKVEPEDGKEDGGGAQSKSPESARIISCTTVVLR